MTNKCCTCSFWRQCFCGTFCFWCPAGCETSCVRCFRWIQNFFYCVQKWICIIIAIPLSLLKLLKHILCCLALYLLLGLILAGLVILVRTFCTEITDFLQFLFVTGSPLLASILDSGVYLWNQYAPSVGAGLAMLVDLELSVYERMVQQIGEHQMELLFQELMSNVGSLADIVLGVLQSLVESDPLQLQQAAENAANLTATLVARSGVLEQSLLWSTGPSMAALLPLLAASNVLLVGGSGDGAGASAFQTHLIQQQQDQTIPVFATQRRLMEEQQQQQQHTSTLNPKRDLKPLTLDEAELLGLRYDTMSTKYVKELQNQWQTLAREYPHHSLDSLLDHIDSAQDKVFQYSASSAAVSDQQHMEHLTKVFSERLSEHVDRFQYHWKWLRNTTSSSSDDQLYSTTSSASSPYTPSWDGPGHGLLRRAGFSSLSDMNRHVRQEYGNGWGLLYSFDLHRALGIKNEVSGKPQSEFSRYLEEMGVRTKEAASYDRLTGKGSTLESSAFHGTRKLQIIPILPDILDCFLTIPPDPLCIIAEILPLPLTPPAWFEPFVDFDCDCSDEGYEDDDGYFSTDTLTNSHLILQTIVQALSSISFIMSLLGMITLPMDIEDFLFLGTPGDEPTPDEVICAILHLDYFLLLLLALVLIVLLVFALLSALWDIYQCLQDLRIRNEHNRLVECVLDVGEDGKNIDEWLRGNLKYTLLNPGYRCFNDPDYFPTPTYWLGDPRTVTDTSGRTGDPTEAYVPLNYEKRLQDNYIPNSCSDPGVLCGDAPASQIGSKMTTSPSLYTPGIVRQRLVTTTTSTTPAVMREQEYCEDEDIELEHYTTSNSTQHRQQQKQQNGINTPNHHHKLIHQAIQNVCYGGSAISSSSISSKHEHYSEHALPIGSQMGNVGSTGGASTSTNGWFSSILQFIRRKYSSRKAGRNPLQNPEEYQKEFRRVHRLLYPEEHGTLRFDQVSDSHIHQHAQSVLGAPIPEEALSDCDYRQMLEARKNPYVYLDHLLSFSEATAAATTT